MLRQTLETGYTTTVRRPPGLVRSFYSYISAFMKIKEKRSPVVFELSARRCCCFFLSLEIRANARAPRKIFIYPGHEEVNSDYPLLTKTHPFDDVLFRKILFSSAIHGEKKRALWDEEPSRADPTRPRSPAAAVSLFFIYVLPASLSKPANLKVESF